MLLWLILVSAALVVIASLATPNLLRSRRTADGWQGTAQPRAAATSAGKVADESLAPTFPAGTSPANPAGELRKIVQTVTLALTVRDVEQVFRQVTAAAQAAGGYVESSNLTRDGADVRLASARVRVPADKLDAVRSQFRGFAVNVDSEQAEGKEVTAEYVDLASSLRNFRAEEEQYLAIMKRSGSIAETLEVARSLADVRGRIERTQGRMNLIDHQVAMATVDITLRSAAMASPAVLRWQPLAHARASLRDALANLADWADFVVAALFQVPVILLWLVTVLATAMAGWRLLRWTWRRFFAAHLPAPAA